MRKKYWIVGCCLAGMVLFMGLGLWFNHPAQIDWARRSRDGISDFRAVQWRGKNLSGANLAGMVFRESSLQGADFRGADLRDADFSGATYVDDADFRGANLQGAQFQGASARRANFAEANLQAVDFEGADLSEATFKDAILAGTLLTGANLRGANLAHWQGTLGSVSKADLRGALLPADSVAAFEGTLMCLAVMPSDQLTQLAYDACFTGVDTVLNGVLSDQNWREAELKTYSLFMGAQYDRQGNKVALNPPCSALKQIDQLWVKNSQGRLGYAVQRRIWESPAVDRDYGKFATAVGWKQDKRWLKFDELNFSADVVGDSSMPQGHLPWHRWQVLEPTEAEPTRFLRQGWGQWMAKLKQCGI
jgi:uncharacterized protein YjbI with pentapeptide repeats